MPKSLTAFLILATSFAFSRQIHQHQVQKQRYLISPDNEVFSLDNRRTSEQVIQSYPRKSIQAVDSCQDTFIGGFPPDKYPPLYSPYDPVFGHKSGFGTWFVAPAGGTIDTLYWLGESRYSPPPPLDSLVLVRIDESNIGPGKGPGYDFPVGCYPWGYYHSIADADNAVAAFPNLATDTTWISTTRDGYHSYPLMGNELWGFGGYPAPYRFESINILDLEQLTYKPHINAGQVFWVSMYNNNSHPIDPLDEHFAPAPRIFNEENGAPVPSRRWLFNEHTDYITCHNRDTISPGSYVYIPGWYIHDIPNASYGFSIWYSMTVETDLPPTIVSFDQLHHTAAAGPYAVTVELQDCNPPDKANAGVSEAWLLYSFGTNVMWDSIPMQNTVGDIWIGVIPPSPSVSELITYAIRATDVNGNTTESSQRSFRNLARFNSYYALDTMKEFVWNEIHSTGTRIGKWFTRLEAPPIDSTDNTTAGPFDLGGEFNFFGHAVQYCWIGVDGGFHVTVSPTDTFDLGFGVWSSNVPNFTLGNNLISPFGHDFYALPRVFNGKGYGDVYYKHDGTRFIVEWDHIGYTYNPEDTTITFEAILDRSDNSITFLYKDIGSGGLETKSLVGLQADTSNGHYFFVLDKGYPLEWRPQNERGLRFTSNFQVVAAEGWNLVSAPGTLPDPRKSIVFPVASSPAFNFEGTYVTKDLIERGKGYWVKYPAGITIAPVNGTELFVDTIPLQPGWNMSGSISRTVAVSDIVSETPGLTISQLFGYNGSTYYPADSIEPGKGYWVNTNTAGAIILSTSSLASSTRVHIIPTNKSPPLPPSDIEHPASHVPKEFAMSQNYPNPFNPVTELSFIVGHSSFVTLRVYDVLGREVATIVNENLQQGEYTRNWDASNFPSGVYYYRLTAGTFTEVKKLLLLR